MLKWILKWLWGKSEPQILICHMHVHVDGKIDLIANGIQFQQQAEVPTPWAGIKSPTKAGSGSGHDPYIDMDLALGKISEPVVGFGQDQS